MSGEQLYPHGHHPSNPRMDVIMYGFAKVLRRRDVANTAPVKYYFTDFEASMTLDESNGPILIRSLFGQDRETPELNANVPYSPFPVDIFTLGNVYQKRLIEVRLCG